MSAIHVKVIDNSQVFIKKKDEYTVDILESIGEAAMEYAREYVPVDTGALRDSIYYSVDSDAVRIGATMEYAGYVELGTRYQQAQPYLKPAVSDHAAEYEAMAESIYRGNGKHGKNFRIVKDY